MGKHFFDYDDGDFAHTISDNMAIDSDGDLLMRMGDNMAMDMDSGELHSIIFFLCFSHADNHLFKYSVQGRRYLHL